MTRRFHSIAAGGLLLALLLGLLALLSPGSAAAYAPRAQLRGFNCQLALDPANRTLAIRAVMRPLPATRGLQLKFDLLVNRAGSSGTSAVRAGDLGVWFSPKNPTLGQLPGDVWHFDKSVVELGAPATYRFRVAFRWIGAHDQVIGSAVRFSRRCHQRELRPDLLVDGIGVTPVQGRAQLDVYTAVIGNAGATAAGPFVVEFVPGDGSAPTTQTVVRLGGYQDQSLSFVGPVCSAATPPTIIVDSTLEVDDLNRDNNTMTAVCPAAAAPAPASSAQRVGRYTR